jgi:membrane associated rhomboid family serine protease
MRLSGRKTPSFTRPWAQQQRLILLALIVLNTSAYVAHVFLNAYDPEFARAYLGLSKAGVENAYAWQFVTAALMHASVWHFLGNTIVLTSTRFLLPVRLKAKHLAYTACAVGVLLVFLDRSTAIMHGALLGGCAAGWLYAHLLGFGRPSRVQRALRRNRAAAERYEQMDAEQFIAEEVDPLLEKISRTGIASLTRAERRTLAKAREKLAAKP